jgi:hypothetical protein
MPSHGQTENRQTENRQRTILTDTNETSVQDFGRLVPIGGGDPIPLLKKSLLIGRRESCDIVLRFKNVSDHHCQLTVRGGYWYIKDMTSLNGVKDNDVAVTDKRLDSGDQLTIAKQQYRILYAPSDLGAVGPPPSDEPVDNIFGDSLLKRAGLEKKRIRTREPREQRRFEVDSGGDLPDHRKKPPGES